MAQAVISWISGPVLRARVDGDFHIYEALKIGPNDLLAEVVQLSGNEIVAQVYEDTTGLKPGDLVSGAGHPLSVALHPGLLGGIYDGLLRPLHRDGPVTVAIGTDPDFAQQTLAFEPSVSEGDTLEPGQKIGTVRVRDRDFSCTLRPDVSGQVAEILGPGTYDVEKTVCVVRDKTGQNHDIAISHPWPVRLPRPVAARLPANAPMITGQRILDTLFPVARGGRAALPGGFGTGKTVLQQALAMWCDADVIVYVGCGERGNEMAEVLEELPSLTDPRTGAPLMERSVIIANTSNMPVAAREASVYTAISVAEYFRDQGLHVALMADSTSRWAEALREVSGRLGELPAEAGYPAYLSSRLAEFYERAARVKTLNGDEGSVTIIGAVSPPAGDFSEPVTVHTKRLARCFWALDRERAQARFYPAIHPLQSYSEDAAKLAPWWRTHGYDEWARDRRRILTLLEQQSRLERMARIVGRDALPPTQRITLICAHLASEALLRQSAFSPVDRYCTPKRQIAMTRVLMRTVELATKAVERGVDPNQIEELPIMRVLQRLGEEFGEDRISDIEALTLEVDRTVHGLKERARAS